ncbi:helix-turn-helix domain-containing protein [Pectobacterium brasiliense]|uniref:helix-turn-helix domain-containing protein n=1 Tax=Pectobacterium brasiliense TaxID=180957 RepID=UPI002A81074B|nr:helix-turn-helix transcriptional regulator [Pectobacterium brasiliense]MDY4350716.1 helix-turn-helix transcriptional regulator [Pectobacterium brasiliense]
MSMTYAQKLKSIRIAEGLTQKQLSELTGVSLGMIKNYESDQHPAGVQTVEKVIQVEKFEKYTLWLMTGKTAPVAGQISPPLSPDGQDNTKSHRSVRKTG